MKALLTLILVVVLACPVVDAQNMRRTTPRGNRRAAPEVSRIEVVNDTVALPGTDSIAVAGFEKPLRVNKESVFVSNYSSRELISLSLDIIYMDMQGRMLHRVERSLDVSIPSGETRRVEFPSFDTSSLFYYHLSPSSSRAVSATPFDVKITVTRAVYPIILEQ
ncbi:MAG: hypothetical protein ACI31C_07200 [Muribaculaceae bacterium]